jgi:hypothetical protein
MQKTADTRAAALLRCYSAIFSPSRDPVCLPLSLPTLSPSLPTVRIFVRLVHYIRPTEHLRAGRRKHFFFLFFNNHEQFFLSSHEEANMPGVRSADE